MRIIKYKLSHILILSIYLASALIFLAGCNHSTNNLTKNLSVVSKELKALNPLKKVEEIKSNASYNITKLKIISNPIKFNREYLLAVGKDFIADIDNKRYIIELKGVEYNRAILYVNNKIYSVENHDKVEINKDTVMYVNRFLINSDPKKNLLEIKFKREKIEHYPDILIEKNLGDFKYVNSNKHIEDLVRYKVNYFNKRSNLHIIVNVIAGGSELKEFFLFNYPKQNLVRDLVGNNLYIDLKNSLVAWISDKAIVEIRGEKHLEQIIDILNAYLTKYPSILNKDMLCKNNLKIKPRQTVNFKTYNITNYVIESDQTATLKINEEFYYKEHSNDVIKVNNSSLVVYIKGINTFINHSQDNIELCVNYLNKRSE